MLDLESLVAINIDQIVTRTDLVLLRARAQGVRSRRSYELDAAAAVAVAVSRARMATAATQAARTRTMLVRIAPRVSPLLSVALVAASVTWLAVTALCLLA